MCIKAVYWYKQRRNAEAKLCDEWNLYRSILSSPTRYRQGGAVPSEKGIAAEEQIFSKADI
jgi:hypothetical protein